MSQQISLRLPKKLLSRLDATARAGGTTRSDVIRAALEAAMGAGDDGRAYDRVRDLIGSVSGGPRDLGARHRKYLAGLGRAE